MGNLDPGVIALLGGMGGAVLMLLLVLLLVVALALPIGRAVVRFIGNFDNVTASRARNGKVQITGGFDDWREQPEPEIPELTNGRVVRARAGEPIPAGTVIAFESDSKRGQS